MATSPVNSAGFYADFSKLDALRNVAQRDPQAAVKSAAKQFEGIFTQMMLKSMRAANLGEGLGDSEETKFYQDMFDQQLSMQLANGKGMGLADKLLQQLQRSGLAPGGAAAGMAAGAASDAAASGPAGAALLAPAATTAAPLPLHIIHAPTQPQSPTPATPVAPAEAATGATAPAAPGPAPAAPAPEARARREAFIASIQPAAARVAQQLGVATEAILAHAALETGWGQHMPSMASNNLFGVKAGAGWQGESVPAATTEVLAGQPQRVPASFRAYGSLAAGLEDYAKLLGNSPRYAGALNQGGDVAAFARGLQRGGYATDPGYADKLVATAAAVRQLGSAQPLKNAPSLPTNRARGTA
jgi:flagellar protein FlgJ